MMLGNGPPPTRTIGVENVAVSLAAQIVPPVSSAKHILIPRYLSCL
jgi:hypothetical protein